MAIDENGLLPAIWNEYDHSGEQYRATWTAYSQAMTISVSGILVAFALAVKDLPYTAPFFVLGPFVLLAWYSLLSVQGRELTARDSYARELERLMRDITDMPLPFYETGPRRRLYGTWHYQAHMLVVAVPFLCGYAYCMTVAAEFLLGTYHLATWATYGTYLLALGLVLLLHYAHGRVVISPGIFAP